MKTDYGFEHFGMEPPPHYDVPPLVLDDNEVRSRLRKLFEEGGNPHEPTDADVRVQRLVQQASHFLERSDDSQTEYLLRLILTLDKCLFAFDACTGKHAPRPWKQLDANDAIELVNRILTAEEMRKQ